MIRLHNTTREDPMSHEEKSLGDRDAHRPHPPRDEAADKFIKSLTGEGPRLNGADFGKVLHSLLSPRPGRETAELTPERNEAIDRIRKGIHAVIARETLAHGPDKELDSILNAAIATTIIGIDHMVYPGFAARLATSVLMVNGDEDGGIVLIVG